jgi:hypothetical protein
MSGFVNYVTVLSDICTVVVVKKPSPHLRRVSESEGGGKVDDAERTPSKSFFQLSNFDFEFFPIRPAHEKPLNRENHFTWPL